MAHVAARGDGRGQDFLPGRSPAGARPQSAAESKYAVLLPLVEDMERHGMGASKAFEVLREGRRGLDREQFMHIIDCCAHPEESRQTRSRRAAQAWALARPDASGLIGAAEFERLVAEARRARSGTPQVVAAQPSSSSPQAAWKPPSTATPSATMRSAPAGSPSRAVPPAGTAPPSGSTLPAPPSSTLRAPPPPRISAGGPPPETPRDAAQAARPGGLKKGQEVSAHFQIGGKKSANSKKACVEKDLGETVEVAFASGVHQTVLRSWITAVLEPSPPPVAELQPPRSSIGSRASVGSSGAGAAAPRAAMPPPTGSFGSVRSSGLAPPTGSFGSVRSSGPPTGSGSSSTGFPAAGSLLAAGSAPSRKALVGLENLGNSCYMNAVLQCMASAVPLVRYCLRPEMARAPAPASPAAPPGQSSSSSSGGNPFASPHAAPPEPREEAQQYSVAREFATVLKALTQGGPGSICRPKRFKMALGGQKDSESRFNGQEQQDAQDFAAYLLSSLHEELNRVRSKQGIPPPELKRGLLGGFSASEEELAAEEAWQASLQRDNSVVLDLFQGQLRSQICCLRCGLLSVKFELFLCLSLPVLDPHGQPLDSLEKCFREFLSEEKLSGDERWYCPLCNQHVDAVKTTSIWRLPPLLFLHLKRFRFDPTNRQPAAGELIRPSRHYALDSHTAGMHKLAHTVKFGFKGEDLNVLREVPTRSKNDPEHLYDLFGIVEHVGSCAFGHYTAVVRLNDEGGGADKWVSFDDDEVTPLEHSSVQSSRAYLLFLERRR